MEQSNPRNKGILYPHLPFPTSNAETILTRAARRRLAGLLDKTQVNDQKNFDAQKVRM